MLLATHTHTHTHAIIMRLNFAAVLALAAALLCAAALVPATADDSVSAANKHGSSAPKPKCYIPFTLTAPLTAKYVTTFLGMSVFTGEPSAQPCV